MPTRLDLSVAAFLPRHQADGARRALERAALLRVVRVLAGAIADAPTEALEGTASSASDLGAIAEFLLEMSPSLEALDTDPLATALLTGALAKRELHRAAGGMASVQDVATMLGISRQAVDKRRRADSLLAVPSPSKDWWYPRAQFSARGEPLAGLDRVLRAFRVTDPWMRLDALLARDPALGERSALEALARGEVDAVIRAVASFGDQGL